MTYIKNTALVPEIIRFYTISQPVYSASWYIQGGVLHFDYNSPNITLDDPTNLCSLDTDAWTLPIGDYDIDLKWKVTYSSTPTSQANIITNTGISPAKYVGSGTVTSLSANNFKAIQTGNTNVLDITGSFLCRITNANAAIKFTSHPFTSGSGGSNISSTNEYTVICKRYPLNTF